MRSTDNRTTDTQDADLWITSDSEQELWSPFIARFKTPQRSQSRKIVTEKRIAARIQNHCSLTVTVSTQAPNGASRAVGTHYGPTRIHVPTGAFAIGGTATLAQRCSIISATAAARTLPPGRLRAGKGCWGWAPPPLPPGPQDLPRDYGPDGAAGGLKPEYTAASGPRTYGSGPTTGTRSQTTCYDRRGTGRVRPNSSGSF